MTLVKAGHSQRGRALKAEGEGAGRVKTWQSGEEEEASLPSIYHNTYHCCAFTTSHVLGQVRSPVTLTLTEGLGEVR